MTNQATPTTTSIPSSRISSSVSAPLWQRFDWALITLLLLCAFSLRPLLVNEGLSNGPDVLYHTYRTAEMARSWEHGVLMPRWAEGMYYGYGSPLFHYYASMTYYLGSALMLGVGMTALEAMRAIIVISTYGAALGMYGFMRVGIKGHSVGRVGALLSALAYVYAPYIISTEPYGRGAYPELLAFAIFPWVMWAFARLLHRRRGIDLGLSALALAVLVITHNLMALVLTGLLAGWLVWHFVADAVTQRLDGQLSWQTLWRPYGVLTGALVGGLGLSAYFWLPALGETSAINLSNVTAVPALDYRNAFVALGDLLGFAPRMDEGAINGLRHILTLGVVQWVLALAGLLTTFVMIGHALRRGEHDHPLLRNAIYFAVMALVMIFLMLPASLFLWDALSPLALLQFPWRFLGPVAFSLAVLVGMNALWLIHLAQRWQIGALAIVVASIVISAFPALYAPEWTNTNVDASITGYLQAELDERQSGTTYTDEYRPIDVDTPPNATMRLVEDYRDGYPIDKANVPADVDVALISNNPHESQWRVRSDEAFTFEMLNYMWLGWVAEVDGASVPITPSPEHGLITFDVPAGAHDVRVYLGSTPLRFIGNLLTAMSVILVLGAMARLRGVSVANIPTPLPSRGAYQGIALALILCVVSAPLLLRDGVAWLNSPPGTSPASISTDYRLDEHLRLLGYDLPRQEFQAGDTVALNLYWYAEEVVDIDFSVFVHISQGGAPLAQADRYDPGGRLISLWWEPTGYILDEYDIDLPTDMPTGEYTIFVGMYTCALMPEGDCGNGYRPTVTDGTGEVIGDMIPLATITVR
jgi:hypothetical protein